MDGSRTRRTKDPVRKAWYAHQRQFRFARLLGFGRVERRVRSQCMIDQNAEPLSLESGCDVLTSPAVSNLCFSVERVQSNPSSYPEEIS